MLRLPKLAPLPIPPPPDRSEIGTAEAARRLRMSQRSVQRLCKDRVLIKGQEWRCSRSGRYIIRAFGIQRLLACLLLLKIFSCFCFHHEPDYFQSCFTVNPH